MNSSSFVNFRKKLQLRVKPLPCDVNFFSSLLTNINLNETYKNFIQKPFVLFISVYNTHVVTATTRKYFKEKVVFISFVIIYSTLSRIPIRILYNVNGGGTYNIILITLPKVIISPNQTPISFFCVGLINLLKYTLPEKGQRSKTIEQ